jgi:hypothetical protein
MEPRCGKSAPIVVKTCYYYERKSHPLHVNALLVIAFPNGVHRGWVTEAFPENVPRRIKWQGLVWRSEKTKQVGFKHDFKRLCEYKGLALLAINVEALTGEETRKAIGAFLKARGRVFVVFDESSALASSNSLRASIMANLGRIPAVVMMADLDGTPVDKKGPLDLYSQIGWMGHDILGYPNEVEFRTRFAEIATYGKAPFWRKVKEIEDGLRGIVLPEFLREAAIKRARNEKVPDEDDVLRIRMEQIKLGKEDEEATTFAESTAKKRRIVRGRDWWTDIAKDNDGRPKFRNMEEIWSKLEPISYRATFAECFPDAKQKVYQKRYFQLTAKQRKVYEDLRKYYRAVLDDGAEIKAEHPLTRMLRAQQITSNYYPDQTVTRLCDNCAGMGCEVCGDTGSIETEMPFRVIDDINPRIEALKIELSLGKPAGVWCRFRPDVDNVLALAQSMGISACRYDGAVGANEKADSREGFQSGKYDLIVGNEVSLSRGIPLYRAEVLYGYSNLFSFRTRVQVENRAEHGRKTTATQIVDLVAEETVDDMTIIPALRVGMDISQYVMQDPLREWI